jgi:hypothetical protein
MVFYSSQEARSASQFDVNPEIFWLAAWLLASPFQELPQSITVTDKLMLL